MSAEDRDLALYGFRKELLDSGTLVYCRERRGWYVDGFAVPRAKAYRRAMDTLPWAKARWVKLCLVTVELDLPWKDMEAAEVIQ